MTTSETRAADFSLIMPCYNEEEVIGYTIPRLVAAFEKAGHRLQLIACDNGSSDRTGEIIRAFRDEGLPIVYKRVEVNQGYGNGILESLPLAQAPWIGFIPADGQVDAEDVVRLYESVKRSNGLILAKVRRRFRLDGPMRALVSIAYNLFIRMLWPRLGSADVNGSPKILHRDVLRHMDLQARDWLLDPEMMIKAYYMGLRVLEMNVFARMREHGTSHVRASTCRDFIVRLLAFRMGRSIRSWRRRYQNSGGLPDPVRMAGVSTPHEAG